MLKITNQFKTRGTGSVIQQLSVNKYDDGEATLVIYNESKEFAKAEPIKTLTSVALNAAEIKELIEYLGGKS